ncbi:hypothetical protein Taro_056387 [Colocasia esculenta]|uniref:Uncharacterized protein n=1 Tax=Colocasia esculenta TaxID=4460 RepID=A0A843XW16_COLES|nr:hypothetical protein [Colocasia esculenta]
MKFKRRSKSRMGIRLSDEHSNYESSYRHRAEECWKKLGALLKCGGRDHRIPDYPMLKDQPRRAQNVPQHQGCLNAVIEVDLPEEEGMGQSFIARVVSTHPTLVSTQYSKP